MVTYYHALLEMPVTLVLQSEMIHLNINPTLIQDHETHFTYNTHR